MIIEQLTINHLEDFHHWISNKQAVAYSLSAFLPERDIEWSRQYLEQITSDQDSWNQVISVDDTLVFVDYQESQK